ncbi:putative formin, FH2 domain-containing protein [Helianthus annuus]|nr:putative formin, FH2 domain-containing protein [Helianthus annuus]
MLTKVKMPPAYMVEAVLAMDDTLLDVDQVENILKFCPTKEEMNQLKFFLELMKVPRMEAKLNTFMFKLQFSSQVRKSVKFREVIKRILYLGGTLNQGTSRVGFKLDSLLKLSETRGSNSNMTLMHYLCKLVSAKSPALLDFPEDLVCLEAATKVYIQLRALAEEMLAFRSGLKKVRNELEACANDGPVSDGFRKVGKHPIVGAHDHYLHLGAFQNT